MATLYEIITRANVLAAGRTAPSENSPVIDNDLATEALFDHALTYVYAERLRKGENVEDLKRVHEITFSIGAADLPETALRSAMRYATMPDREFASYLPPDDFRRQTRLLRFMDYFTFDSEKIRYRRAGVSIYTGDENFSLVTMPKKNSGASGLIAPLDLHKSVVDDVVLVMAGALTGEISIQTLMENKIE